MERSRRSSSRGRDDERGREGVPAASRLTLGAARRNRRRAVPLRERMPRAREVPGRVVIACGRMLRRAAPALLALATAGAVGGGAYAGWQYLTTSPSFAIDTIHVSGARTLGPDGIRARIPVREGDNVFRADLRAVEAALEAEPWIADAEVRRRLPRAIEITVRERQAAALVDLDGLYLAAADGEVFKRAQLDLGEGDGLPVITGIARAEWTADPAGGAARVRAALAALAAWQAGARPAVGEVRVDARHGVTLFTYDDAVAIRLGEADGDRRADPLDTRLATRLARFDAAWAALTPDERRAARAVHLDHDTRPDHVTVAFAR